MRLATGSTRSVGLLAAESCSRSALWGGLNSLAFLEKGGGVLLEAHLSCHPLVKAGLEELSPQLGKTGGAGPKAPIVPISLLMAWERAVVDVTRPVFGRMYAWWQFLRTWATLRFDDHRGLLPARMHCHEAAWTTSSFGRRHRARERRWRPCQCAFAPLLGLRLRAGCGQARGCGCSSAMKATTFWSGQDGRAPSRGDLPRRHSHVLGARDAPHGSRRREWGSPSFAGGGVLLDRAQPARGHAELGSMLGLLPVGLV